MLLIRILATWEGGELHVHRNQVQRFYWAMKVCKVKNGSNINWSLRWRVVSLRHPPLCAGLSTSYDLYLDDILFTQFVHEITDGKENWSFVNYLLFISTCFIFRNNQQQGIEWSKDLKGVLGPEMGRAWAVPDLKVSCNVALLNW